ncbi:uncharacterized protein BP01DRAFT_379748 [Aspergillus saccharolyticus JOP 1030-1]|uniref:Uncharacterized protein n=1 Tax=Aspergillus saccharolyticus JOP 1030-1 TaxID=1450539 RepID=A0A318ZNK9_9EURO|nr:hypothetical protein BP01DRAFT_379748 [Aspergillus saccharolyticus JOP 1030-1]PYH48567.1 hypothetical protein BP01DRAFT_379748 [Aspergillus saccharolyticus JOP 1030-1]
MDNPFNDTICQRSLDFAGFVVPDQYIGEAVAALRAHGAMPCPEGSECISMKGYLIPQTDVEHYHRPWDGDHGMIVPRPFSKMTVRIYRKSLFMWWFPDPPLSPKDDDLHYYWCDMAVHPSVSRLNPNTRFVMPTNACWTEALIRLYARDSAAEEDYVLTRLWHRELLRVCMQLLPRAWDGWAPLEELDLDRNLVGVVRAMRRALMAGNSHGYSDDLDFELLFVRLHVHTWDPDCPPPQGRTLDQIEEAWWREVLERKFTQGDDDSDDDGDDEDDDAKDGDETTLKKFKLLSGRERAWIREPIVRPVLYIGWSDLVQLTVRAHLREGILVTVSAEELDRSAITVCTRAPPPAAALPRSSSGVKDHVDKLACGSMAKQLEILLQHWDYAGRLWRCITKAANHQNMRHLGIVVSFRDKLNSELLDFTERQPNIELLKRCVQHIQVQGFNVDLPMAKLAKLV